MAKDPAFLFYTGDFATGTQFFTDDQVGKYIRLLMAQHQHGHLSEKQMLHICKSYDNDIFIKFAKDDNGMFFNERLEDEILKRKKYSESRSNNKSGRKPNLNKDLPKEQIKSYDYHMENENEIKIDNEKEDKIKNASLKILTDFNFTETKNFNKLIQISDFVRRLISDNRFDYFIEQYPAYWKYKESSGSEKQSLDTFLNNGWDREVWTEKLKQIKPNGTNKQKPDLSRLADLSDKILANSGIDLSRTNTEK
jgi:uncharacterized protein YdaU (DUF1376 family)